MKYSVMIIRIKHNGDENCKCIIKFRKNIIQSLRKAAFLRNTTPTVDCEGYLFGMSYLDYVNQRIIKFCHTQASRNQTFLENIHQVRNVWRPKRGKKIGVLLRKYCEIRNGYSDEYFKNVLCLKRKTVDYHKNTKVTISTLQSYAGSIRKLQQQINICCIKTFTIG